jgi:hypothetical protein
MRSNGAIREGITTLHTRHHSPTEVSKCALSAQLLRTPPTASLSVVSLGDVDFGPLLLAAFGGVSSIFVTLSLPDTRPVGGARRVILRK